MANQSLWGRIRLLVSAAPTGGLLQISAKPVNGAGFVDGVRRTLRVVLQLEENETVGITISNEESDTVAYLQGGAPLIALTRELGLTIAK